MERFIHNANVELYRRLLAESKSDLSRDEDRHKMLMTLLAEEMAKDNRRSNDFRNSTKENLELYRSRFKIRLRGRSCVVSMC